MTSMTDPGSAATLPDLLNDLARGFADRPAVAAPWRISLTFCELSRHVERVGAALRELGLGRGDRIALVLPNGPELATAFLCVAASAVCAPLNPALRADELRSLLSAMQIKALIVERTAPHEAVGVARSLGIEVIALAAEEQAPAGIFMLHGRPAGAVTAIPARSDDLALLLHTSGSTSRPKLVPLLHRNLCASASNISRTLGLSTDDCCLNIMPLFHVHGLVAGLLSSLAAGGSVVCAPQFSPPAFFEWMAEFRPTWYTAVPSMHQAILTQGADRPDVIAQHRLRFVRSSSAALPTRLMRELEALFDVPVIEAYGATEAAHQIASNPLPPGTRKPRSVGLPAGPEVAILDVSGTRLRADAPGDIAIRGANVMPGYASGPDIDTTRIVDGWFRTGDQGYLDADGYLFLTGRIDDVINRGGEKISPREVDDALLEHPAIAQAVAFPVAHPTLGQDLAAAVVLNEGASESVTQIREFLLERLPVFKMPSEIVVVPAIPTGPTGKLRRNGLANTLAAYMNKPIAAPRNEIERIVAGVFAEVLMIENFGVDDNFFALGGDSIRATQIVTRIASLLGTELEGVILFRKPTISALVAEIAETVATMDPIRGRAERA